MTIYDLSDAVEPEVIGVDADGIDVPGALDRPFNLSVVAAELKEGVSEKTGGEYAIFKALLRITDSDSENPKPVEYAIFMPKAGDAADSVNRTKLKMKKFKKALGYDGADLDTFDTSEEGLTGLRGLEATAMLKVNKDEVYGAKNVVRYWL